MRKTKQEQRETESQTERVRWEAINKRNSTAAIRSVRIYAQAGEMAAKPDPEDPHSVRKELTPPGYTHTHAHRGAVCVCVWHIVSSG